MLGAVSVCGAGGRGGGTVFDGGCVQAGGDAAAGDLRGARERDVRRTRQCYWGSCLVCQREGEVEGFESGAEACACVEGVPEEARCGALCLRACGSSALRQERERRAHACERAWGAG